MSWKVLLLDDNPRSAEELQRALREVGCDVRLVADRRTLASVRSLSRLAPDRVDAVLVSVAGPRFGGLELFERIHRDTRAHGTPVVVIGSDEKILARHESSLTPAEGYVRRPADHEALVVELGAGLLAVVGAGTRTVPPPPPGASHDGRSATDEALRGAVAHEASDADGVADWALTQARVPREATSRAPDDKTARIEELEVDLERSLELLRGAAQRIDADRIAHDVALAAAIAEASDARAKDRAMGESALLSMATELHTQSVAFARKHYELEERHGEDLRLTQATQAEIAAQRDQLRHALVVVERERRAAVEERDAVRGAAEALAASAASEKLESEARLAREITMRRADQELAVAALRSAEERIASLEARTTLPPSMGERLALGAGGGSGELRVSGWSMPPESHGTRSVPPVSGYARERRSSGPPPLKSGSRAAARLPASLEGDRDDTRPTGRAVLLIDGDKTSRVSAARALARAGCEVTVCDSCADVAAVFRTFDVVVTEIADVAIELLLNACNERVLACAIVVWTPGVDAARTLFEGAGIQGVTFLQKAYRPDDLVTAVRARLDGVRNVAHG
jgi:DNA-binding response OmpR family regulator